MVKVGPRNSRLFDVGQTEEAEPTTPQALPRDVPFHRSTPIVRSQTDTTTCGGFAAFVMRSFRAFKAPVAGAIMGGFALPASGASVDDVVRQLDGVGSYETTIGSNRSALRAGPIHGRDLYEASLRERLRVLANAQFEASPSGSTATDILQLERAVARFDGLIQQDLRLPANLLADLDRVLTALEAATPGTFQIAIDTALHEIANPRLAGMDSPTVGEVPPFTGPGDGPLRRLLDASLTDLPDHNAAALATYTALMNGVQQSLGALPSFTVTTQVPLIYNNGGTLLVIPPGARVTNNGGDVTIEARRLLLQHSGVTLVADEGTIRLGNNLDGLQAGRVAASGDDWSGDVNGLVLGVRRTDGVGVVRADRADVDLANGTAQLENGQLLVAPNGDSSLTADALQVDREGFSLNLEAFDATQTRDGTSLTTQRIDLVDGATQVRGDRLTVRFGPDGASITGDRLDVTSGPSSFALQNGTVDLRPLRSGGHALSLSSDNLRFRSGDTAIDIVGGATAQLELDATGQLRSLQLAGDDIQVVTPDGHASLTGTAVQATLDERGTLRTFDAFGERLAFDGAGFGLVATEGRLGLAFDEHGRLSDVNGESAETVLTLSSGTMTSTDGAVALNLDGGELRSLQAGAEGASWRGTNGTTIRSANAGFGLAFDDAGRLDRATLASGQLEVATNGQRLEIAGLDIDVRFDDAGLLDQATARAGRLDFDSGNGTIVGAGDVFIAADATEGRIDHVTARATTLDLLLDGQRLAMNNGALDIRLDGDRVRTATASFDDATYEAAFGRLDLTGGTELGVAFDDDGGATIRGAAHRLDLANDAGLFELDGGRVEGTIAPDGTAVSLGLQASRLTFNGTAEGGHPLSVDLETPSALLTHRAEGGQRLDIETGGGHFVVDGHRVTMEGVEQLTLETTPDGKVDTFTADFDGQLDFVDRGGDLSVLTRDVATHYDRQRSTLTLDFTEADVALLSEGLRARIEGGHATLDEQRLFVSVEHAEVLRELGDALKVEVESMTVELTRSSTGALETLDLRLGSLDAEIAGIHAMVRTPSGERVRLFIEADESGAIVEHAFLQIPAGGEIEIKRGDLDVRLGEQFIRYTMDDDGTYRLRGEDLDVEAITKNLAVRVDGGDAEISLDPSTGHLVIEQITGTQVNVVHADTSFTIDVEAVNGFMLRATQFGGEVAGGAFHLVPTEDGSRINAFATGVLGDLPFTFAFSDVHELEGAGRISENQVHAFIRDPSGEGHIDLGFGPLELSGSAIEYIGRYHPFDTMRMTDTIHRFTTLAGTDTFSGVRFDDDGVVRLGTDRDGLNAELAVILPRGLGLGTNHLPLSSPTNAPGVIGTVGYRVNDVTFGVFGGLVPGAHVTSFVKQGELSFHGVPVPRRLDIPATAVAGARLDVANVGDLDRSIVSGGYLNPAGLVDVPHLHEPSPYGLFGGLDLGNETFSVSATGVADMNKGRVTGGGVALLLNFRF